ncbi:MAG: bacteriohopanetetrol glucosamine biosynthesis glycosyltransferase HpnI [Methylocella sp.]
MPLDPPILRWVADLCAVAGCLGCAYLLATIFFVRRLVHERESPQGDPAPVTLLKPLHGGEPDLLSRLASLCNQKYAGATQIVFGCHDHRDAAIAVVNRLQAALPSFPIDLVVGGPGHGSNRKISNLINMAAAARHDVLVISDSDIEVGPDYLADVMDTLQKPGIGAVTCLYHGVARDTVPGCFSALAINGHFLPNVLMAIILGLARPCFGATIAMGRETLERIGGFRAFADELADDHAIGEAVRAAGYRVAIPSFSVGHACNEQTFGEFFGRQLRFARTIKSINPIGFAGAVISNPLPLAVMGMLGGNGDAPFLLAAAIVCRFAVYKSTERAFRLPRQRYWLLPAVDLALFAVFVASFFGSSVAWRGHHYRVLSDGTLSQELSQGPN